MHTLVEETRGMGVWWNTRLCNGYVYIYIMHVF